MTLRSVGTAVSNGDAVVDRTDGVEGAVGLADGGRDDTTDGIAVEACVDEGWLAIIAVDPSLPDP